MYAHISKVEAIIISTAVIHNIACDLNHVVSNISPELEKLIHLTQFRQRQEVTQNNPNYTIEVTINVIIKYFESFL